MHDEYHNGGYLYTAVTFPASSGETPLQHYNTSLAVGHIQTYADAAIYF